MVFKANALNIDFNPNDLIYAPNGSSLAGLATVSDAALTTDSAGVPTYRSLAADGNLLIGSGSGPPLAGFLTPGPGISITNGPNSITIGTTGGGLTWTEVTGATQAMAVANGYITNRGGGVTYTLPATAAIGDEIQVVGKLGLTTIAQNANQQISVSSSSSTIGVAGSIVATNVGDCVTLTCITAGAATVWRASALVGNWTIV